jgi:hypothetical protein
VRFWSGDAVCPVVSFDQDRFRRNNRPPSPRPKTKPNDVGFAALVSCANPAAPLAVTECALDALCAAASHHAARPALRAAGAVPAAAAVVATSSQVDSLVRALMVLGMLVTSDPPSQAQLVEAEGGRAVVRLLSLARQDQDADCQVISKDLLGLLTRDPGLRAAVEAAVRRAAEAVMAAAAVAAMP